MAALTPVAKIDKMPSQSIIDGYRGVLDFYVHCGIPCVRSWPRSPSMPRSPAVQDSAALFGYVSKEMSALPPFIIAMAKANNKGTGWTWRDLLTAGVYGNLIYD